MTIAPMVLDQDQPSAAVKDAFQKFAPDGFATIVQDEHGRGGKLPKPQVWKGMPILDLINSACDTKDPAQIAAVIANDIGARGNPKPGFYLFRIVWVSPTTITRALDLLRKQHPELDFQVVGPRSFFGLFKKFSER